ncbi:MAG: S1C family serine protease, partial [Armatimonadota bacterium]
TALYALLAAIALLMGLMVVGCPGRRDGGAGEPVPRPGDDAGGARHEVLQRLKDAVSYVEVTLSFPDGAQQGIGSGFAVNDEGRIVTNAHVVSPTVHLEDGTVVSAGDRQVRVIFHSGTDHEEAYPARVLRENPELDLALLQVDARTPAFLELADSDVTSETAEVIAAGYPLGFREISLRTGTVTAHRTFEGMKYIEHDAEADSGNSGGPVVDELGRVVGVHTQTRISRNMSTKWAIPSNVLRDWLASDPADDPPVYFASAGGAAPTTAGAMSSLEQMISEAGLMYSPTEGRAFELPYDNEVMVYVHEWDDLLRAYVIYGDLPSAEAAVAALAFTYHDPVGRFSIHEEDGTETLYWEAQVPMGVASPEYLRTLCDTAASQVENFAHIVAGDEEIHTPTDLYPGGDDEALFVELGGILGRSGLKYEQWDEQNYKIPFDNGVDVYAMIFSGMAYIHSYIGGFPGDSPDDIGSNAVKMLRFNWDDPIGRVAVDDEFDVVWECQVPMSYLTPDYAHIVADVASTRVEEYRGIFGRVPFNEER